MDKNDEHIKRAMESGRATLDSILEMVKTMKEADEKEDYDAADKAREEIMNDALSVEVRTGWFMPGGPLEYEEYRILLGTGGPAIQIVGGLDEHNEPATAVLQCQDWFTPWVNMSVSDEEREALLTYARCFYFS